MRDERVFLLSWSRDAYGGWAGMKFEYQLFALPHQHGQESEASLSPSHSPGHRALSVHWGL